MLRLSYTLNPPIASTICLTAIVRGYHFESSWIKYSGWVIFIILQSKQCRLRSRALEKLIDSPRRICKLKETLIITQKSDLTNVHTSTNSNISPVKLRIYIIYLKHQISYGTRYIIFASKHLWGNNSEIYQH